MLLDKVILEKYAKKYKKCRFKKRPYKLPNPFEKWSTLKTSYCRPIESTEKGCKMRMILGII